MLTSDIGFKRQRVKALLKRESAEGLRSEEAE